MQSKVEDEVGTSQHSKASTLVTPTEAQIVSFDLSFFSFSDVCKVSGDFAIHADIWGLPTDDMGSMCDM